MKFKSSCVVAVIAVISTSRVHSFSAVRSHDANQVPSCSSATIRRTQFSSCCSGKRIILKLCSKKSGGENTIIDAVVEEKTAGLALTDDEENTTVSVTSLFFAISNCWQQLQTNQWQLIDFSFSSLPLQQLYSSFSHRHEKGSEMYSKVPCAIWHH